MSYGLLSNFSRRVYLIVHLTHVTWAQLLGGGGLSRPILLDRCFSTICCFTTSPFYEIISFGSPQSHIHDRIFTLHYSGTRHLPCTQVQAYFILNCASWQSKRANKNDICYTVKHYFLFNTLNKTYNIVICY